MRIRHFLAILAVAAVALPAAAHAQAVWHRDGTGPRGLAGSTYTTGRVPDEARPGVRERQMRIMGPVGYALFRDPRFQNHLLPCDAGPALERIRSTFAEKEARFWNSSLAIAGIDRIRLVTTNPWGQDLIPRRYCRARAHLTDGRVRTVDYAILEDQGMIGATFGVEWCVHGLDRGRSFDPACRMARP
ncbi:hypothetical protein [Phreatobacter sp.]|uniref:hypothetical protein n=1 Tax=Phreatobacter sp. TaxID=1966341 RepID=UPI003F71AC63